MLGLFSPTIFLGPAQRRLTRRGVPVLAYHKIAHPPLGTLDPFLYVSPQDFDAQLAALRQAGHTSAPLSAVRTAQDNESLHVVVTFDDGCRNVLEHGLGILSRHQFRALQFLVPAFLGGQNAWDIAKGDTAESLMDDAQVRDWLAAGHEIGSHSMTHRNLRHLSKVEAREEIFGSKKALEDRFGLQIQHFSYPFGSWNDSVRELVHEAGYQTASTMRFGVNLASTPAYELRRIIPLSSSALLRKICHRLARKLRG
jgi:peptidoglycan/xylan/chitin deacetylase (PgdA/CDA1 family)